MLDGYRVVTVCPAGRRRYTALLTAHLDRQRDVIDEHHWWLNTDDPADVAHHEALAAADPDFHKIVRQDAVPFVQSSGHDRYHLSIHPFFAHAVDPDTIYVRFDDDIVWMDDAAVATLVRHRLAHPAPFLVYANIVNNGICGHLHERLGAFMPPYHLYYVAYWDAAGRHNMVHSPAAAIAAHCALIADADAGRLDRWRFGRWVLWDYAVVSVNCLCWSGLDMAALMPAGVAVHEEIQLGHAIPKRLGRPNEICGQALVAHFSFMPQRAGIAPAAAEILAGYRRLAGLPPEGPLP